MIMKMLIPQKAKTKTSKERCLYGVSCGFSFYFLTNFIYVQSVQRHFCFKENLFELKIYLLAQNKLFALLLESYFLKAALFYFSPLEGSQR